MTPTLIDFQPIDPTNIGSQTNTTFTPLTGGGTAIVWTDNGQISMRLLDANGDFAGVEIPVTTLNSTTGPPRFESAHGLANGNLAIVLGNHVTGEIEVIEVTPAGAAVSSHQYPAGPSGVFGDGHLIDLAGGGYRLLWTEKAVNDSDHYFEVMALTLDAALEPVGTATTLISDQMDFDLVQALMLADGTTALAYSVSTEDPSATDSALYESYVQLLDPAGQPTGDPILLPGEGSFEYIGAGSANPHLSATADGGFLAVWAVAYRNSTPWARFSADGEMLASGLVPGGETFNQVGVEVQPGVFAVLTTRATYGYPEDPPQVVQLSYFDDDGSVLIDNLLVTPGGGPIDAALAGNGQAVFGFGRNEPAPIRTDIFLGQLPTLPDGRERGTDGADTLTGSDEGVVFTAGDGDDSVTGGAAGDVIDAGAGDDTLDGGGGADIMLGGLGNDLYIVDHKDDVVLDVPQVELDYYAARAEQYPQYFTWEDQVDTARASVSFRMQGTGLERLELTGADDLNAWGSDRADSIVGNAGANVLSGMDGDDTIDGGAGADRMIGGPGSDVYHVDDIGDFVGESRNWAGHDLVYSSVDFRMGRSHIEDLYLTGTAILGAGNGLANEIRGNRQDNILDGGKNNDTLMGGAGNDTYLVRAPGDLVIEAAGRGVADTVKAFRAYELTANVERLYLQTVRNDAGEGVTGINGIGNELDNTIVGNPFDNVIIGRWGNDVLKGQAGSDSFVFDRAIGSGNVDRIIDFNVNEADEGDILKLKGAVFGGLSAGMLDADHFVAGTAAADADDRLVFDRASGRLWFDADGVGGAAQVLVATFEQDALVTAADIEIF